MNNWLALYDECTAVCTDSRQITEGCIYIALRGANFNGNIFAEQALASGAKYAIVDEIAYQTNERIYLVDDTLRFLQDLARAHRQRFTLPIIGITGSNGKTSTKELVRCVLSKKYEVLCTKGNLNNHIGVPLTLLQLKEKHQIAVIEMGANKLKDIDELCQIALPTHGLITNIGKAHLEGFLDFNGVLKTKSELYDHVAANNGTLFVNADDPILVKAAQSRSSNTFTYGQDAGELRGQLLYMDPYAHFSWQYNAYQSEQIDTQMVGKYNFYNFLAALSVGTFFGVEPKDLNSAISAYCPDNARSQVKETKNNTLILDCYNANPSSMSSALNSFVEMQHPKKLAILGDMLELGAEGPSEHQKVLDYLNEHQLNYKTVGEIFRQLNPKGFAKTSSLMQMLEQQQLEGYLILLKGSRAIALEQLVGLL